VLIAGLGFISKAEVSTAVRDIKAEVSTAVRDMERRFELLAGQALKAPVLRISYEGAELDRRELSIDINAAGNFRLHELY
jgi:hypothetical protein